MESGREKAVEARRRGYRGEGDRPLSPLASDRPQGVRELEAREGRIMMAVKGKDGPARCLASGEGRIGGGFAH